jgi:hypothetical protein
MLRFESIAITAIDAANALDKKFAMILSTASNF